MDKQELKKEIKRLKEEVRPIIREGFDKDSSHENFMSVLECDDRIFQLEDEAYKLEHLGKSKAEVLKLLIFGCSFGVMIAIFWGLMFILKGFL
ncbi:MAG: hypothetical protein GY679_01780 [Mycoplasma sp.]|nr:hypothetical protein [Mycoplasma sp.]